MRRAAIYLHDLSRALVEDVTRSSKWIWDLASALCFLLWQKLRVKFSKASLARVQSRHPQAAKAAERQHHASDDCLSWEWRRLAGVYISAWLGTRMEEGQLGTYDSPRVDARTFRHFYTVPTDRLSEALALIASEMERAEVLPCIRIGYADAQAKAWRTYNPSLGVGNN